MKVNVVGRFENSEPKKQRPGGYVDTGCKGAKELGYFGSCTNCTLVKCLEDDGVNLEKEKRKLRNNEIINQRLRGATIDNIAASLNVCSATVKGVLKNRSVLASK